MNAAAEELRQAWLKGTTCAEKARDPREVLFFNGTHIVLRHRSHSEYAGRMRGSSNCPGYAKLYDVAQLRARLKQYGGYQAPFLKEWTGRLSLKRIREDCAQLGIPF